MNFAIIHILELQFFKSHNLKLAAFDITTLLLVLVPTIRGFAVYDRVAARLMIPYALFSMFAAALNLSILRMNGSKVD